MSSEVYDSTKNVLLANKCCCGTVFFPKVRTCRTCGSSTLEDLELSRQGQLYGFTVIRKETLAIEPFTVPYAFGYIDLPEGARVMAHISTENLDTLEVGLSLHLAPQDRNDGRFNFKFQTKPHQ